MKERPILFSGPMVRAILDGRKTVTRRVVKPQPHPNHVLSPCWGQAPCGFEFGEKHAWRENGPDYPDNDDDVRRCPHGKPGDRLWVRETFYDDAAIPDSYRERDDDGRVEHVEYRASHDCRSWEAGCPCNAEGRSHWRPSIFMPRWASRITLEVVGVRVERLQEITEAEAMAEGVQPAPFCKAGRTTGNEHVESFEDLWDSINAARGFTWASNPWVWVVEFRRLV